MYISHISTYKKSLSSSKEDNWSILWNTLALYTAYFIFSLFLYFGWNKIVLNISPRRFPCELYQCNLETKTISLSKEYSCLLIADLYWAGCQCFKWYRQALAANFRKDRYYFYLRPYSNNLLKYAIMLHKIVCFGTIAIKAGKKLPWSSKAMVNCILWR